MPNYIHKVKYPLRDKQQDKSVCLCDRCHSEQYIEDTLYFLDGMRLCGECIDDKFLAMTTAEKAELLGARQIRVGE